MYDVKRLLRIVESNAAVEISTADDGVSEHIVVRDYTDLGFVSRVLEGAGFHQVNKETASEGTVEFSNKSLFSEDETETANESNGESNDGENEDQETDALRSHTQIHELAAGSDVPIDGDGRSFTVLVDADTHKLANKIFSEVLGNEEDKSQYGAFLYDFDNFLSHYQNPNPPTDDEEDVDDDTQPETPISTKADAAADDSDDEAAEDANPKVKEIAAFLFNTDAEVFFSNFGKYMPETAGSSPVFKVILGLLVQVAVTAIGKALLEAWDQRDKGLFERLLFKLVKIITKDYFPTSDSDDSQYSKYEYDAAKYSGTTIDLDDEDFDYEGASAELAGVDLDKMEIADIQSKRFMRLMIAIFVRVMGGYIGRQLVNAWMKRDKRAFTTNMNLLVEKCMTYFPAAEKASTELEQEIETAKKAKSGRGALLSSVMKALSGKLGTQAAKAWDDGDLDSLGDALGKAAEQVLEDAPFDESKSGDTDDKSDNNSDASDTDATVDADAEPETDEKASASTDADSTTT